MKQILVYGDSLWLDSLAQQLCEVPGWSVVRAGLSTLPQDDTLAAVDLVLILQAQEAEALPLLRACPSAALVSVDMAAGTLTAVAGTLTAVAGQTCPAHTLQEIVHFTRGIVVGHTMPI